MSSMILTPYDLRRCDLVHMTPIQSSVMRQDVLHSVRVSPFLGTSEQTGPYRRRRIHRIRGPPTSRQLELPENC